MLNDKFFRPGTPSPALALEDVDTRVKHYIELHDLWAGALATMMAKLPQYRSAREDEIIIQLTHSTELLKVVMTGTSSDYHREYYEDIINSLPKDPNDIV